MTSRWYDQRTCARKRRYPSYEQARHRRDVMQAEDPEDVTLQVYRCAVCGSYHLGHAKGRNARTIIKRAEKRRRKDLIRQMSADSSTST